MEKYILSYVIKRYEALVTNVNSRLALKLSPILLNVCCDEILNEWFYFMAHRLGDYVTCDLDFGEAKLGLFP